MAAGLVDEVGPGIALVEVPLAVGTDGHAVQGVVVLAPVEARQQDLALVDGRIEDAVAVDVGVDEQVRRLRDHDLAVDGGDAQRRGQGRLLREDRHLVGLARAGGILEDHDPVAFLATTALAAVIHALGDEEATLLVDVDVGGVEQLRRSRPDRDLETFGHREELRRDEHGAVLDGDRLLLVRLRAEDEEAHGRGAALAAALHAAVVDAEEVPEEAGADVSRAREVGGVAGEAGDAHVRRRGVEAVDHLHARARRRLVVERQRVLRPRRDRVAGADGDADRDVDDRGQVAERRDGRDRVGAAEARIGRHGDRHAGSAHGVAGDTEPADVDHAVQRTRRIAARDQRGVDVRERVARQRHVVVDPRVRREHQQSLARELHAQRTVVASLQAEAVQEHDRRPTARRHGRGRERRRARAHRVVTHRADDRHEHARGEHRRADAGRIGPRHVERRDGQLRLAGSEAGEQEGGEKPHG